MQGRFKRDSGAAGEPEQQPGGTGNGSAQGAGDSGAATPGTTAATGRSSTPSGIEAGKITGLDGKTGPRIAMRNWRISTRLVSLLALPVVTASALGGLRINSSLDNIHQLEQMKTLTDITENATDLAAALQEERDSSAGPLASHRTNDDAVAASRAATDRQVNLFEKSTDENISADDPVFNGVRTTLLSIDSQLHTLTDIRGRAYTGDVGISQTVTQYDSLIQSLLALSQDMAQATSNHEMIQATRALAAFSSAKEYESMQRAVISAAFATGKLLPDDYQTVNSAYTQEATALTRFTSVYGPLAAQELLAPTRDNDTIQAHDAELERIAKSPNGFTKFDSSYRDWDDAAKTKIQAMRQIESSLLIDMQQKSLKLQSEAKQEALISGAIILLVLGVAVVGAFIVARSMIRSLRRLQQTAQEVAQKRLPELVRQLSETDPQDVDTSVESIGINSRDEIGQVARAFDEVHSEAVRLAAEQALLRGNVNAMFTNLSRRSQGLIQRQLSLISELESREADPDQLSSLFKLDHLATRMRRNGENLLVLAGEEPGRRWTRPVPLVDVLRAAASEVEQYERIELTAVPSAEVTGRIVNDLVHLLAELLENATSFSSPQTKVRVTGHSLPDGRVLIEIHDTGIGLSPEDLADINERLANPPTVDVSVSRRMGLFVVGRLSLRHGIRIQLRPSDSGGTTALVMLPVDVTQGGANAKNTMGGAGRPAAAPPAQGAGGSGIAGAFGNTPRVGNAPQRGQVGGGQQRPAIGAGAGGGRPGAGGPGGAPQQPGAPRWAAQDGPQGFPDDRGVETARGHEDVEGPGFDAFDTPAAAGTGPRADFQQGPGDPFGGQRGGQPNQHQQGQQPGQGRPVGGFPPPQPQNTGPDGFRSDVFGGRPGPAPRHSGGPGPDETAQFPVVREDDFAPTGQGPGGQHVPGGPAGPAGPGGPGGYANNGNPGAYQGQQQPGQPGQQGQPGQPGRGNRNSQTGQFPLPGQGGGLPHRGQGQQAPVGQGGQGGQGYNPRGPQDPYNPNQTGQFPVQGGRGQSGPGGPVETGQFPLPPQPGGPGGPGDTTQFPAVRDNDFAPTGQHGQPGPNDRNSQTGQFPVQHGQQPPQQPLQQPVQQQGQHTPPGYGGGAPGQYAPQGGPGGLPHRDTRGQQGSPGWAPGAQDPYDPAGYGGGNQGLPNLGGQGVGSTGQYPTAPNQPAQQPGDGSGYPGQQPGDRRPAPNRADQHLPVPGEPMALPPAPTRGDEPTPIFSAIESDWFRTGQAERMQQIHVEQSARGQQQVPAPRPVGRTAPPAPPQRPRTEQRPAPGSPQRQGVGPQQTAQVSPPAPTGPAAPVAQPLPRETPNWRSSPNDALRQRAEQVREPSAGGVTPSGLPRRVPRANLVAGGAAPQQAPQGGPQVSRAPDDVRGRLTNLRRGIQQGRQAGGHTDGRGFGTNSQER
ncbi:nitrate- and nitrite sensing domain-containing protein [Streptomyces sp. NBC_01190]|uniref:nitrate- and nitrite sensing domain-containing protein n=1 Tax=Streptomyces sp. NBC_01190 TaxID=2903767 RepID=UPI0038676407|nr:nitrate- and nitrite sensing domain-containing protein [Streptomyces sp. NBC_01190]